MPETYRMTVFHNAPADSLLAAVAGVTWVCDSDTHSIILTARDAEETSDGKSA